MPKLIWTIRSTRKEMVNRCQHLHNQLISKFWRISIRPRSRNLKWVGGRDEVTVATGIALAASIRAGRSTRRNAKVSTKWPGMTVHRHPILYRRHRERIQIGEAMLTWTMEVIIVMQDLKWILRIYPRSRTSFTMPSKMLNLPNLSISQTAIVITSLRLRTTKNVVASYKPLLACNLTNLKWI